MAPRAPRDIGLPVKAALTDEQKAQRAADRAAQRKAAKAAERIRRFHLLHPWKRKTEGAGAAELDGLFTGARPSGQTTMRTGRRGTKVYSNEVDLYRPASPHQASKRGHTHHTHPRHVSRVVRRVRRRGGAATAPLGYADRLTNYQAQNDARSGHQGTGALTTAQQRRLAKKQRHLAASRVPAKRKIISERASASQVQRVIRQDTRHIEHGSPKLSWGKRAASQLHAVQRRSQRGA
jgi:hypothetical protein